MHPLTSKGCAFVSKLGLVFNKKDTARCPFFVGAWKRFEVERPREGRARPRPVGDEGSARSDKTRSIAMATPCLSETTMFWMCVAVPSRQDRFLLRHPSPQQQCCGLVHFCPLSVQFLSYYPPYRFPSQKSSAVDLKLSLT